MKTDLLATLILTLSIVFAVFSMICFISSCNIRIPDHSHDEGCCQSGSGFQAIAFNFSDPMSPMNPITDPMGIWHGDDEDDSKQEADETEQVEDESNPPQVDESFEQVETKNEKLVEILIFIAGLMCVAFFFWFMIRDNSADYDD